MILVAPQALLLLLPLGLFLFLTARIAGPPMWLRCALVTLLTLALSRPELRRRSAGSDVVVIVDRSRSMPPRSETSAAELIRLLEPQRGPGDRLGVISFGREPRTEMQLTNDGHFAGFGAAIDAEASNLSAALDAALEMMGADRSGRVLVLSDGRATGLDARAASRRLSSRGVAVDIRYIGREEAPMDVAVTSLLVPSLVAAKEPFLLTATVRATGRTQGTLRLLRNGRPVATTHRELAPGATVLTFRDVVDAPGLAAYELRVDAADDGVAENDLGRAVLRVDGPPRVLLLTDKPQGTLAKTLKEADLNLETRAPAVLSMAQLDGVAAVVLEDVEAGRLGEGGLRVLAQFVKAAGGGLVMTGGKHSFGEGGYRSSPVEELLPVSLEIREEQRTAAIAMAIVMDCSCSMGASVPDGRTKMELAAEGVVGALQLLNPRDEASVYMVDTSPHQIFPMSPVADGLPLSKVARGFSGGGGIYIGVGLRAAKQEILSSGKQTRHVLLFADAADSEEPDDYQRTLADLAKENVTVSVIGMGSRADQDAKLLEDVARRGNGRIYFAEDVTSLPRIFSQETIAVARSSFVDVKTATKVGAALSLLGKLTTADGPVLGGYNLTYLKPLADVGLRTIDTNEAPILALWPRGTGRVGALAAEVDGPFTGDFGIWAGQRALLTQLVRWTMPPLALQTDAVARARLSGDDLHVTLDVDTSAPPLSGTPTLVLLSGDARKDPVEVPMRWEDEDRVGAHFILPGSGTWHPVVKLGGRIIRAPPVALPWAPEFEPTEIAEGKALLASVARAGGGVERLAMAGLFREAIESETAVSLVPVLVALSVALLVAEVFTRRMLSWPRMRRHPRFPLPVAAVEPVPSGSAPRGAAPAGATLAAPPKEVPVETVVKPQEMKDALAAARERARKRMDR